MLGLDSLLMLIVMKKIQINFKSPKKVFMLRFFLIVKYFYQCFFSDSNQINIQKKNEKVNIKRSGSSNLPTFQIKLFLNIFLFHFVYGTYTIRIIYFSILKKLIKFPSYIIKL
jgi:hypothetical protein